MELLHAIAALVALVLVGAALVAVWALRAVRAGRGTIVMAADGSQTCVYPPSDGLLEHPSPYAMIVAAGLTVRVGLRSPACGGADGAALIQGRIAGHITPSFPVPTNDVLGRIVVTQAVRVNDKAVNAYRAACGLSEKLLPADTVPILFPAVRHSLSSGDAVSSRLPVPGCG